MKWKTHRSLDGDQVTFADGTPKKVGGIVSLIVRSGKLAMCICFQMFPSLQRDFILGQPWLVKWNPQIKWASSHVVINKNGRDYNLEIKGKESPLNNNACELESLLLSISQVDRLMKKGEVERVFLAVLRGCGDEGDESGSDVEKLCKEGLDPGLRQVLEEYKEVFRHELPPRLPLVWKRHEFRIDLVDDEPPIHHPIYKMSPLELQ